MPPHTTLQYTMPASTPATTSAAAKSSSSSTSAPAAASSKPGSRQRRATTASSFIFAPSWLTNHKDKAGSSAAGSAATASASTAPSPSHQSASENPGSSKSVATNAKEKENNRRRDSSPSLKAFPRTSSPPRKELTSSRFPSTSDSLAEKETTVKSLHSRSHSSQASSGLSFSPSNFDRNFPTLARKKAATLSVDLPPRSVENIWASSDAKSRVLSPTTPTPTTEEDLRLELKQLEEQEEIERLKSLVPKVDSSKFDGKRNAKRKPSRSLSMDSPGSPVATPLFGSRGRTLSQAQQTRAVSKTGTSSPTRPRATSAAGGNGVKKNQIGSSRAAGFLTSSKKTGSVTSNGGFSKYSSAWSNPNKMGRVGIHKMYDEVKDALSLDYDQIDEEDEDDYDVDPAAQDLFPPFDQQHRLVRPNKDATATIYTAPRINGSSSRFDLGAFAAQQGKSRPGSVPIAVTQRSPSPAQNDANEQRSSRSLELEERFLCELGWQKPTDEDADSDKWTITDEERRSFVNLICALNGVSIDGMGERGNVGDEFRPTREDIERAGIRWTTRKRQQQQQHHGLTAFGHLSDVADRRVDGLHEESGVKVGARDSADEGGYRPRSD